MFPSPQWLKPAHFRILTAPLKRCSTLYTECETALRNWNQADNFSLRHPSIILAPGRVWQTHAPNLSAARAFALAASSSRFFGGAFVSSERRRRVEMPAISSTAARNELSFAFDGLLKPLIFLTNWSEAARISSAVTGGSKLKRVLIFLHIHVTSRYRNAQAAWNWDGLQGARRQQLITRRPRYLSQSVLTAIRIVTTAVFISPPREHLLRIHGCAPGTAKRIPLGPLFFAICLGSTGK